MPLLCARFTIIMANELSHANGAPPIALPLARHGMRQRRRRDHEVLLAIRHAAVILAPSVTDTAKLTRKRPKTNVNAASRKAADALKFRAGVRHQFCTGVSYEQCFDFSMAWIWNEIVKFCASGGMSAFRHGSALSKAPDCRKLPLGSGTIWRIPGRCGLQKKAIRRMPVNMQLQRRKRFWKLWIICSLGMTTSALSQDASMSLSYQAHRYSGVTDFRFIYADGPITLGTAERFRRFVNTNQIKSGATVIFNSPGGSVSEALEVGRQIRAAGFDTSVGIKGKREVTVHIPPPFRRRASRGSWAA